MLGGMARLGQPGPGWPEYSSRVVDLPLRYGTVTATPPQFSSGRGLWQVPAVVVASLDPDIGSYPLQRRAGSVLAEDGDGVHASQGSQYVDTVCHVVQGAPVTLQPVHRGVRVEADDQAVAERPRRLQQADVTCVQQVKAATRRDHGPACRPDPAG